MIRNRVYDKKGKSSAFLLYVFFDGPSICFWSQTFLGIQCTQMVSDQCVLPHDFEAEKDEVVDLKVQLLILVN